jgi:uncharacterized protein YndB with AHSA1/START domain
MRLLAHLTLALALTLSAAPASVAAAPSWRDFPGVSNTSYVEPSGDRALQLSIDIPAPAAAVFKAYATTEGFTSWAVPVARVDLRIGGSIESSYDAKARLGDRDNIRNEILAYVPNRLVVLRNVQAPRAFEDPELFQKTVTVVEFAPLDAGRTRVTVTNAGYGPGPRFDALYRRFEWGDAFTLAALRDRFVKGPTDWTRPAPQAAAAKATGAVEGKPKS